MAPSARWLFTALSAAALVAGCFAPTASDDTAPQDDEERTAVERSALGDIPKDVLANLNGPDWQKLADAVGTAGDAAKINDIHAPKPSVVSDADFKKYTRKTAIWKGPDGKPIGVAVTYNAAGKPVHIAINGPDKDQFRQLNNFLGKGWTPDSASSADMVSPKTDKKCRGCHKWDKDTIVLTPYSLQG